MRNSSIWKELIGYSKDPTRLLPNFKSMRFFLVFILLSAISIPSEGQLSQLFFFKDKQLMIRDTASSRIAHLAITNFWEGNCDSANFFYGKLLKKYPDNARLHYHLAANYAAQNKEDSTFYHLGQYLHLSTEKAVCQCFRTSKHFKTYLETNWMDSLYKTCWNYKNMMDSSAFSQLSEAILADYIRYHLMIDQEILGHPRYLDFRHEEEKDSLLWQNLKEVINLIDTLNLPTREMIGIAAGELQTLFLHADYDGDLQVRMGHRMLADSSKGYGIRTSAFMIDRGLSNKGLPQQFGTLKTRDEEGRFQLYQVDDPEKMNKLRRKIGLKPIDI